MSNNQLATMKDLQVRVAETVQAAFGQLIPDDVFKELTDKAIQDYFYKKENFVIDKTQVYDSKASYHTQSRVVETIATPMSHFEVLVFTELTDIVKKLLDEYFVEQVEAIRAQMKATLAAPTAQGKFAEEGIPLFDKMQQYQTLKALEMGLGNLSASIGAALSSRGVQIPGGGFGY